MNTLFAQIVHGDLKASNALLTHRGDCHGSVITTHAAKISIADFGLATVLDNDSTHVSGTYNGTITHMAPETLEAGRKGMASDVFAFGVLLRGVLEPCCSHAAEATESYLTEDASQHDLYTIDSNGSITLLFYLDNARKGAREYA
eukprot:jgi/Tetstr1/439830/TSEL_028241.t1